MNKSERMQIKAVIVLIGILFMTVLLIGGIVAGTKIDKQPEGEFMKAQDAGILLDAAKVGHLAYDSEYLSFGEMLRDLGMVAELQKSIDKLTIKYEYDHLILKKDWYELYDEYLLEHGLEGSINRIDITSFGAGSQLEDTYGNKIPENVLITKDSQYTFVSQDFIKYRFVPVSAYQKDGILLTVYNKTGDEYQLSNAWIMEASSDYLKFFWNDYEIRMDYGYADGDAKETLVSENLNEQVADIFFKNGMPDKVIAKTDKVTGKILSLDGQNITIEGVGTLPFSKDVKIYQIYDKLVSKNTMDLRIGYGFTDFVIQDEAVEACLITRDEAMENIRVLISDSDYNGKMHKNVKATSDTDFIVRYGTYDDLKEQVFQSGDIVEFGIDSAYFMGERITIIPKALTGKVQLLSVNKNQGNPWYRGNIEILKTSEGLAVINEVLLEEYLYSVVPSEMPASYPLEALKAQAVCARTYAYRKMINSGLPSYGAHLDDSTAFQVYNNINENAETTKAVRETKGELLYYGNDLADTYYYSTSCGFGTTTDIWQSGNPTPQYLQSKRIGFVGTDEIINENTMMDEEVFGTYIENVYDSDYDSSEEWYRWNYTVGEIDAEAVALRMQTRQKINPNLILAADNNDNYVINEVEDFTKIYNIKCIKRGMGGILDSILIETDCGTYKIIGEYNIRYVLNNGEAMVVKQGGNKVKSPTLLPSAFFILDILINDNCVTGYEIVGGGFGHGVGMSQNGAKNMALKGMDFSQILTFFYDGTSVNTIY